MINSSLFLRIGFLWNYVVVRWQLLLTLLVLWLAGLWLKSHYGQDDSNLWLVMNQFVALIRWSVIALFSISLLMALMAWGFFLYAVRNKQIAVRAELGDGEQAEAGLVPLKIVLTGTVIRPLLGTIRARLIFTGKEWSETIVLDTDVRKRGSFLRQGVGGSGKTLLHDRGIYDVEKIHILFCDMFNLIALPCTVPFSRQLYTLPRTESEKKVKAAPHAVEDQKYRIEIPKRIEGEYINYKEFESGDNIRRIVWKIYAKSGQLVVRIPETKDPYASHLYFYISWFQGFDLQGGIFDAELLNVFKDKARNLFEALQKNGYDVSIPADQEVPRLSGMSEKKNELFQITAASWQHANPPSVYVKPSKAAFVCLSSLTPADDVGQLIRILPLTIPILVIKLSEAIPSPFQFKMADLFFRPEKSPASRLQKPWVISPLRQKLLKNEKELERILNERGNGWVTSTIDISA